MKRFLTLFIFIVFCAAVWLSARAQENKQEEKPAAPKEQPYKLSVRTNLVLVPVVVTGRDGQHVTGLKQEDFEVKEDGAVQKIVRLDELSADSGTLPPSSVEGNKFSNEMSGDHPKKLEIIAIDQINTPFANRADAQRGILGFLQKNVDANTLLALVAFRTDGVHVIHNFTADPSILVAAVKKVQPVVDARDTLTQNVTNDLSQADIEAAQIQALFSGGPIPGAISNAQAVLAARAAIDAGHAQVDSSRQTQGALITLECLQQVAQYFNGVPGRKSLIWASSAFPFSTGSSITDLTRGTTYNDWQQTFKVLQDSNVSVYPVDVSGLVPSANINSLNALDSNAIRTSGPEGGVAARGAAMRGCLEEGRCIDYTEARHDTMRQLADMTGGQPFYNSNNGAELFRRAAEDASQYYLLAYYTKPSAKPGWRKLSVKVHQDGTRVRSRSGFFFHNPDSDSETVRGAEEMMALDSEFDFRALPITGVWEQVERAGNQRKVHFQLNIPPGVSTVEADNGNHISFDFRVAAKKAGGQVAANIGQRLDTKLDKDAANQVQTQGLGYANVLTLDPGEYKVHFVVRDNLRGALGSIVVPLKVE